MWLASFFRLKNGLFFHFSFVLPSSGGTDRKRLLHNTFSCLRITIIALIALVKDIFSLWSREQTRKRKWLWHIRVEEAEIYGRDYGITTPQREKKILSWVYVFSAMHSHLSVQPLRHSFHSCSRFCHRQPSAFLPEPFRWPLECTKFIYFDDYESFPLNVRTVSPSHAVFDVDE